MIFTFSLLLLLVTACTQKGYETISKQDANGYAYQEVSNDPLKARIYTLENGLKVYLSKNTDEPRIQTLIAVMAGSKDEPRDNTGLAHYLEHMMFKGTNNFGTSDWEKEKPLLDSIHALFEAHKAAGTAEERKAIYAQIDAVSQEASQYAIQNEYDKIVGSMGASGTNAFTSYDLTAYVNDIPSNELEKYMKLELDRFSNLQLRLFHTELETVYEEFNMYQDMGNSVMWNQAFGALFAEHPYKTDVIGLPEHLKTPSMNSVMEFHKNYYVPNNMAVCLSGDLDFENAVQVVDKYFGQMKPNENLKHAEPVVEAPLTKSQIREALTPDQERLLIAYRCGGAKSEDAPYLNMISQILYNGKAGLVDLNLIQKQKVLNMVAGMQTLKDYGLFCFIGTPREGQTLEEVAALVQEEINKLKAGDFSDELMEAVINNMKLSLIESADGRYSACNYFMDAFINEMDWQDYISEIDRLSKLKKEDVVAFANKFFQENYVCVYKRTGENKDKVSVEKPTITAVKINRDSESDFAKELMAMKPASIEPVFLDFEKVINHKEVKKGIDFYYTENQNNNIYSLNQYVNISNKTDKMLALAFQYLPYLGTSRLSPEELKMEMYKLAMYFNAYSAGTRSYVSIYGLNETMDRSLALMEEMINNAVVNQEAYNNLVDDILKQRSNQKLNKSVILRNGLVNYAKYGPLSSFTDVLTEEELNAINPQDLIGILKKFASYEHGFFYYGPDSEDKVFKMVSRLQSVDELSPVPAPVKYPELALDKPVVYFADYDMVQAEIMLLAKDKPFTPGDMPQVSMFNSYYGSGMNSIVFQEIREARGLAYSAYAYVSSPPLKDQSRYLQAYVGTQADKMGIALDAFKELLTNMPSSEKAFQISKETELNNIRSQRITKSDIFWTYMSMKDLGINYDYRKPIYEAMQTMELADVQKYFDEHINPAKYSILIVGKKDLIDFNYLKKYAEVKELTLEEVFGY